jgi:hypothetical protein
MLVTEHVWRTEDGRLVAAGHPDAAYLAYAPGMDVADREAQRVGLSDFLKSRAKPQDKSLSRPMDKGVGTPGRK